MTRTFEVWLGTQCLASGLSHVTSAIVLAESDAKRTMRDVCHYEIRIRRS